MMDKLLNKLDKDISSNNPNEILEIYTDIFRENIEKLHKRKIDMGKIFFRARAGCGKFRGAIDDLDIEVDIPYFQRDIEAAPIFLVTGGRFNREGNSFLYLASDINTCVSELKLEKNQICSIGKFECVKALEYLDLTINSEDDFFNTVKEIMLQPIHNEIRYKYLITQFISDIIKSIGFSGIIYESTQGTGENIVCFDSSAYKFVDYSDEMHKVTRIIYEVSKVEEGYKEYHRYDELLNTCNLNEEDEQDKVFDYIQNKIDYEKNKVM